MSPSLRLGVALLAIALVLAIGLNFLQRAKPSSPGTSAPGKPPRNTSGPVAKSSPEEQGNIEGEVLLEGPSPPVLPLKVGADPICAKGHPMDERVLVHDGRIRNVVVRIANGPSEPAPSQSVEVNQEGCIYRPRIQAAVAGQGLVVRTSDPILHNVHAYFDSSTLFNQAQTPGSRPIERTVGDNVGTLKLRCDVHPWMLAFILVTNNSFFAVSGDDGRFRINGVPAGSYVLEAWHERFGKKSSAVRIEPRQTLKVSVNYSAEDRGG